MDARIVDGRKIARVTDDGKLKVLVHGRDGDDLVPVKVSEDGYLMLATDVTVEGVTVDLGTVELNQGAPGQNPWPVTLSGQTMAPGDTIPVQLKGQRAAKMTTLRLSGFAQPLPDQPLQGRRTITVSHNGSGGSVYIGTSDVVPDQGLRIGPNSSPLTMQAGYNDVLYAAANPFEWRGGFAPQRSVYLPYKGTVVGLAGNSLYVSYDLGASWELLRVFEEVNEIGALTVIGLKPDGEYQLVVGGWRSGTVRLYTSEDSGQSWDEVYYRYASTPYVVIGSAAPDGTVLIVGLGGGTNARGVYRSVDFGRTWEFTPWYLMQPSPPSMRSVAHLSDGVFVAGAAYLSYAQGEPHIWRTKDGGETWEGLQWADITRVNAILPLSEDVALFVCHRDSAVMRIIKGENLLSSDAQDATFTEVYTQTSDVSQADVVSVAKNEEIVIVATQRTIRLSDDHGVSWRDVGWSGVTDLMSVGGRRFLATIGDSMYMGYDNLQTPITVVEGI